MKVVCKKNTAKGLDLSEVTTICSHEVRYPLILEKEYIVMGMVIYKDSNCIYYLLDEYDKPDWVPYMLFEISHNELSPNWFVKLFDKEGFGDLFYLSGFYEMCNDGNYHDDLIEREKYALDIYHKRKYEVQEWYFSKG